MTKLCLIQYLGEIAYCTRERHTSRVLGLKFENCHKTLSAQGKHKTLSGDVGMTSQ